MTEEDPSFVIQELLRESEEIKVAVSTRTIASGSSTFDISSARDVDTDSSVWEDPTKMRILSVVVHVDYETGEEQGCVFTFKPKPRRISTESTAYAIDNVFPIIGGFSISMAQPRRATLDLSKASSLSSASILSQSKTELTVTIRPGHDPTIEPISLLTRDTHGLRTVLAECKRLKELTEANYEPEVTPPFTWIIPYISNALPGILSPIPPDLRHIHRPVHSLLSKATAGQPADETLDISLIREHWVRHKVYDEIFGPSQKLPLRIRIGTFNVNGKLPSQDLSPWLRENSASSSHLPPIKQVSPFSLGEHASTEYFEGKVKETDTFSTTTEVETTAISETDVSTTASTYVKASASSSRITLADSHKEHGDSNDPDMFVLGFQELDLSTEALLYSTKTTREEAWFTAVLAGLGEKAARYCKLVSKQLVGMLIIVVVKNELAAHFSDIQTSSVGAGILGLMGNKGATAVRLVFTPPPPTSNTSSKSSPTQRTPSYMKSQHSITRPVVLTFVNSHLAAFDEMYDRRNSDYHDLSRRLSFDSGIPIQDPATAPEGYPPPTIPLTVYQSDILFWMVGPFEFFLKFDSAVLIASLRFFRVSGSFGDLLCLLKHREVRLGISNVVPDDPHNHAYVIDLNYRINLLDTDIRTLLAEQPGGDSFTLLQRYDQLKVAIRTKKAFTNFLEHNITHPPTYRFSPGVATDNLGYDMKRKPAWTDRVLYTSSPAIHVEQLSYSSHPEITMSDHKPVSADFFFRVPVVNSEQLESFVRSLWRDVMDIESSDEIPKIKPHSSALDFGKIFYKRTATQVVTLENVGKVPCAFRFVPITEGAPVHPEWVMVKPMSGLIRPGETLKITLVAEVNKSAAQKLNAGSSRLDDTLILHTSLGKDHFIAITGQYQRTCFATSLERLVTSSGPVRDAEKSVDSTDAEAALNAPQEVMRLVNWLMSNAINVKNLFLSPGDSNLVADIRECLDTGAEFSQLSGDNLEQNALAFASCLIELLSSLPEPLIPGSLQPRCAGVTSRDEAFELLDELPGASVNVWICVTAFLHYISQQNADGNERIYAQSLADIFSQVLLYDKGDIAVPISPIGKRRFLLFFIAPN